MYLIYSIYFCSFMMILATAFLCSCVILAPILIQANALSENEGSAPLKRAWTPINGGGLLLNGCYEIRPSDKCNVVTTPTPPEPKGTKENPATSCKAILENNRCIFHIIRLYL